jgi:drug/metabolite transporter (DMT)-like permease
MIDLPALLALTSAVLFALSIQVQSLGLDLVDFRSGALINISATTLMYWLLSPFFIESSYWFTEATLLFALVGLFRPALSLNLAVAGVKLLGPTLTSGLAATAPVFAAVFAIVLLDENITFPIAIGTIGVVAGILVMTAKPSGGMPRGWPLWAMLLPLGAAFFRAIGYPVTMIGFKELPDPFFAGLVSYSVSLVVALCLFKIQRLEFVKFSCGYAWFALAGMINGISIYSLNTALKFGQLLTVAPIVACSPLFTIIIGWLFLKREIITWHIVLSISLVVSGIIVVVTQS